MIREETDAALINSISNMAEVLPFISFQGKLDWQAAIDSLDCIVVSNGEDAVGVFERTADRTYQTHTIFAPSCRGKRALEAGRAMLDFMVPAHADHIWGYTPIANPQARWFNRKLGAQLIGQDCLPNEGMVEVFQYPPDGASEEWSPPS